MSNDKKAIVQELGLGGPRYPAKINFQELSEENKEVVRTFQGKTLSKLTSSMMELPLCSDDCIFYESTHKNKLVHAIPGPPSVQHWTGELLVERIQVEIKDDMGIMKRA
ncbi:hypothetical protein AHAS_Ahas15G0214200 [Arachis hypogaea]